MSKKYSLLLALLATGLIASTFYLISSSPLSSSSSQREKVLVSRAIDGDTLVLSDERRVRLVNINTPEKNELYHELSENYLKAFENKTVEIEVMGEDKYERTLARVFSPDYVNFEIVKLGLAKKFLVHESELSAFREAEENAVQGFTGIWKKSKFFDCFSVEIDSSKEAIFLNNKCSNVSMAGWTIEDESRKIYKFKNITFQKTTLHSQDGSDNSTDIFWNSKTNIWNNDRDTFYLYDSEGNIALHQDYGY